MKTVKRSIVGWLDRTLSGSVFTWQEIIKMLLPFILDSMSIFLISMLITALISSNGEESIAAVSLVSPITNLVTCLFNGIGAGGTVIVAQSTGIGDSTLINRSITHTMVMTVSIGLVGCVPFIILAKPVLYLLFPSAAPGVLLKAVPFFRGSLLSVIPFTVYTAIFSVLRGLGKSQRCLVLTIIINVAYLLFSILFLNFMKLDINGSVLALNMARILGALSAVSALFFFDAPVKIKLREFFRIDKRLTGKLMGMSIPLSMEQVFASAAGVISGIYMSELSTSALAANANANSMMGVLLAPAYAAGNLAVTVVGRCIGAGKHEEARKYSKICIWLGTLLIVLMAIPFYPLLQVLLNQYHPTEATRQTVTLLLYITLPVALIFWSASNTTPYALRSANDTRFPPAYSLSVLWVVNILGGYIFAIKLGLGLMGIWTVLWSAWAIRAFGFILRFLRLDWSKASSKN